MFSLIITIISIALVSALALATLYYGGGVFSKGSADASAAKVILQGQQLLGASELYKAEKGAWPASMAELISSNYLKAIPVGLGPMGQALALDRAWEMPSSGRPVFLLSEVNSAVCQSVNKKTYGMDAVLKTARTEYLSQCFGTSTTALKVVMGKTVGDLNYVAADPLAAGVLGVVSALPAPSDRASAEWLDLSGAENPLAVPSVVYSFNSCNKTGNTGPTLGECSSAYSGTTLAGLVSISGGIQYWTVPVTGKYSIIAAGAASASSAVAGRGAVISAEVALTQGQVLRLIVGQRGGQYSPYSGGGGGGSFVVTGNTPLVVGGGGGGFTYASNPSVAADASTTTVAKNSSEGTGVGGSNGGGGTSSYIGWGGGGGGFTGNGTNSVHMLETLGFSFLNGGVGGIGQYPSVFGGFGGGGGTHGQAGGGGGGGGYSGGGGSQNVSNATGGGGSSYSGGGTLVSATVTNTGAGYITISNK